MLDRQTVVNYWTGKISDKQLSDWTGMATRAVGLVLSMPALADTVSQRGRGTRHVRRISAKARNAVAVVHAISEAGPTFEQAVNILTVAPFLVAHVSETVDYVQSMPPYPMGVRMMIDVDPEGGWQPSDIVPAPIWEYTVRRCWDINNPSRAPGSMYRVPAILFEANDRGTMVVDRSSAGLPSLELAPIDAEPVYQGEPDPLGLFSEDMTGATALPQYDDHLLIVNGRWVFHKQPEPTPLELLQERWAWGGPESYLLRENQSYRIEPIAMRGEDGRSYRRFGTFDDGARAAAEHALRNFDSLLDVNMTLAVRRMKRRAYGLPVDQT